jgi:hypothetical protein
LSIEGLPKWTAPALSLWNVLNYVRKSPGWCRSVHFLGNRRRPKRSFREEHCPVECPPMVFEGMLENELEERILVKVVDYDFGVLGQQVQLANFCQTENRGSILDSVRGE